VAFLRARMQAGLVVDSGWLQLFVGEVPMQEGAEDDEFLDTVLGWAESHGYEPTFGPDEHILMNRSEL
jgi:hypothetical protein